MMYFDTRESNLYHLGFQKSLSVFPKIVKCRSAMLKLKMYRILGIVYRFCTGYFYSKCIFANKLFNGGHFASFLNRTIASDFCKNLIFFSINFPVLELEKYYCFFLQFHLCDGLLSVWRRLIHNYSLDSVHATAYIAAMISFLSLLAYQKAVQHPGF